MKKTICVASSIVAIIYSLFYASFGGFVGNSGALSKIGLTHPILFCIWGILTYFALSFNITVGFMRTKYKLLSLLLIVSLVGMILTLTCDFDYSKHTQYILHCIGSLGFSAVTGITVFLLFLLTKKYILTIVSGAILITDLVLLIIFKETAIIELMPIFAGYIMLCIHNLTKEKTLVEVK
jgi:hypothetical protein